MKKLIVVLIALSVLSCRKQKVVQANVLVKGTKEVITPQPVLVQEKTFSVTEPFNYTFTGLSAKSTYYLQVEGTYCFGGGGRWDAAYDTTDKSYFAGNSVCRAKWQINGVCDNKPVPFQYQTSHVYKFNLASSITQLTVSFHDCAEPPSSNCAYGDNDGTLTFKVYEGVLK